MTKITALMLSDIMWLRAQMRAMKGDYSKRLTDEFLGQTIEFVKGALFERERQEKLRKLKVEG